MLVCAAEAVPQFVCRDERGGVVYDGGRATPWLLLVGELGACSLLALHAAIGGMCCDRHCHSAHRLVCSAVACIGFEEVAGAAS